MLAVVVACPSQSIVVHAAAGNSVPSPLWSNLDQRRSEYTECRIDRTERGPAECVPVVDIHIRTSGLVAA
jgi:hypothetical protein